MAFNDALGKLAAISSDYSKEIVNSPPKIQAQLYLEYDGRAERRRTRSRKTEETEYDVPGWPDYGYVNYGKNTKAKNVGLRDI